MNEEAEEEAQVEQEEEEERRACQLRQPGGINPARVFAPRGPMHETHAENRAPCPCHQITRSRT